MSSFDLKAINSHLFFFSYREKPSIITNQDTGGKTVTYGFLIYSNYQELGCGEIKVNGVGERSQEEDRARLGERQKKQLPSSD